MFGWQSRKRMLWFVPTILSRVSYTVKLSRLIDQQWEFISSVRLVSCKGSVFVLLQVPIPKELDVVSRETESIAKQVIDASRKRKPPPNLPNAKNYVTYMGQVMREGIIDNINDV